MSEAVVRHWSRRVPFASTPKVCTVVPPIKFTSRKKPRIPPTWRNECDDLAKRLPGPSHSSSSCGKSKVHSKARAGDAAASKASSVALAASLRVQETLSLVVIRQVLCGAAHELRRTLALIPSRGVHPAARWWLLGVAIVAVAIRRPARDSKSRG